MILYCEKYCCVIVLKNTIDLLNMRQNTSNKFINLETKKLIQKARNELNEFEEEVPDCLSKLREILQANQSLDCPLDDTFLLRFLRARKFDISKTINLIGHYYEMRSKNPQLFDNLCPEAVSHVLREEIQSVLESRDTLGRNVFIFRAGKWNPGVINLDDIFRCNYLFLEEMTASEETQICGVTAIVDFAGFGFYQARQFTPKHAIRMVQIIQNSFPCRFQEFHLVNQPYAFNLLYNIVKPFLTEKIRKRVRISKGQNIFKCSFRINSIFRLGHEKLLSVVAPPSPNTNVFNKIALKEEAARAVLQFFTSCTQCSVPVKHWNMKKYAYNAANRI